MYGKRVVEVLKGPLEICAREDKMRLWTAEEECVLYPTNTSFFNRLEKRAFQRVSLASADRIF